MMFKIPNNKHLDKIGIARKNVYGKRISGFISKAPVHHKTNKIQYKSIM